MDAPVHLFLSYDAADAATAADFLRQCRLAWQPKEVICWNRGPVPTEAFRAQAADFLEKTDLFVAVLSMDYENTPDVRWEAAQAVATQRSRSSLQILTIQARSAAIPALLKPYSTALPPEETIENQGIARDRQLQRASHTALHVWKAAPTHNDIGLGEIQLPIAIEDLRERLLAQTDRINHAPLLALLKRLILDVPVKRGVLDVEDQFKQLREQTRLSQITLQTLQEKAAPIQQKLGRIIEELSENQLTPEWRSIFIRDYYRFVGDSRQDSSVPPFFVPVDDVSIPETLNLPVGPREQESLEQIGLLSFEQKNDFRRSLLLAKDAMAVKNHGQAYQHCEHVRTQVDPQSAQLYEYLLITFLQKETPLRVLQEAVKGHDRPLQYVLLFASRLREYQRLGKCISSTALHNLEIASEALSDAALRLYHEFPNDPLRHTGKHAESVPDNRKPLRVILENTLKVCRLVHPSEELLEAAVLESCGGGKCQWIDRVDVLKDRFEFVPHGQVDLLGEIYELIEMLQSIHDSGEHKIVKDSSLLREDLYFSLLAKRQALSFQIQADQKRRRPFTDVRESIIRFTYACLLGAEVFGEAREGEKSDSFYRLVLEYLLPRLLLSPSIEVGLGLQWFTLEEDGGVVPHPELSNYSFDVQGIVQKIVQDMAGQAGWLQVQPSIKESVYEQFLADTQAEWERVQKGRAHADIRRMGEQDARRSMIDCLRRWKIAYRANPEKSGQDFLDRCIQELSGEGLLNWLQLGAEGQLVTLSEPMGMGYDAQRELKGFLTESTRYTEESLRRIIAETIFSEQIVPEYEQIRTSAETERKACVRAMTRAMRAYKLHPDVRYLDLVWRELTEEIKFRWIQISDAGKQEAYRMVMDFDPLQVVQELHDALPVRFRLFELRERISSHRFLDTEARYFHEISEYKRENRLPERQVAVEIIRQMKGLFLFFPQATFLKLPLDELHNRGRIRWHANFLGLLPMKENHYENAYFNFEYKFERYEIKRMLDNQFGEMQRVLREMGEL